MGNYNYYIKGKYGSAKVFTTKEQDQKIEQYAEAQIKMICDNEVSKDSKIRVMPDVHPGKVGPIGLSMTLTDRILPNLLGNDIGCGVTIVPINTKRIEFQKLDTVIRENIPCGMKIHNSIEDSPMTFFDKIEFNNIRMKNARKDIIERSVGTLGGGNHFIEIDQDDDGKLFLSVHSGSRSFGSDITSYYLNEGQKELKRKGIDVPYEMTYLEGWLRNDYLNDSFIAEEFAHFNRLRIIGKIVKKMKWNAGKHMDCPHNFIGNDYILRKGAISAREGQYIAIPVNSKDGIILGVGLGNEDWNCSAPHGSGRIIKREEVKNSHTVSEYKSIMKGIHSPSIGKDTLDEAPFAYRDLKDIQEAIQDTVRIAKIIKPIYNFKAGGKE
ncbi:MAG: RtcB family protein [Candidatus Izemoplasmatales bacterium]|nr:RtcB family protein [Candidatus Izemoplasmatales bacterium]